MNNLFSDRKVIGTFVPIAALHSSGQTKRDEGTFAVGLPFLDWLNKTKQSAWQVLPLHETQLEEGSNTKHVPSPYKSYGIGLDPQYLSSTFAKKSPTNEEKAAFVAKYKDWIEDYALFCSLRDHFGTDDWREWDEDIRGRKKETIAYWTNELSTKINFYISQQWQLHQAYEVIHKKARELKIFLIGDLPYYISIQSPLVWAHQEVFQIKKDGTMQSVSGIPNIPPSFFGRQIWGHPLYNWNVVNQKHAITLWEMRIHYLSTLFDIIRFDHIKAFFEYGVLDLKNIQNDNYKKGPGSVVFEELMGFCNHLKISVFAEDMDSKTEELRKSLQTLRIPRTRIFRFAFDEQKEKIHDIYADIANYPENIVIYTTTHDTETLLGYLNKLNPEAKKLLANASQVIYKSDDKIFAKNIRDRIISSAAYMVIIPIQDWLLTIERINVPGTEKSVNDPNWSYRVNVSIEELPSQF